MSRINQPPFGLQSLLGSQNFGDNPSELAQTVVPLIDLWPFLSAEKIRYARGASTLNARGDSVSVTVPEGELWMPLTISARLSGNNDAGTVWAGALCWNEPPASTIAAPNFFFEFSEKFTSTVIGELQGFAYSPPTPRAVWAGTGIALNLQEYVSGGTGSDTFEIFVEYVELKV